MRSCRRFHVSKRGDTVGAIAPPCKHACRYWAGLASPWCPTVSASFPPANAAAHVPGSSLNRRRNRGFGAKRTSSSHHSTCGPTQNPRGHRLAAALVKIPREEVAGDGAGRPRPGRTPWEVGGIGGPPCPPKRMFVLPDRTSSVVPAPCAPPANCAPPTRTFGPNSMSRAHYPSEFGHVSDIPACFPAARRGVPARPGPRPRGPARLAGLRGPRPAQKNRTHPVSNVDAIVSSLRRRVLAEPSHAALTATPPQPPRRPPSPPPPPRPAAETSAPHAAPEPPRAWPRTPTPPGSQRSHHQSPRADHQAGFPPQPPDCRSTTRT